MNLFATAALACAAASPALGVAPFTEAFDASSSNWFNADSSAPVGWDASGQFATTTFNFIDAPVDSTPAFFRAQDEFGSSGNAFVGNYIVDGVTHLTYQVRHDAPVPLTFFARIATPGNYPAVAAVEFAPVLPHTWTTITINVTDPNPSFFYEGPPSTFNSVFSAVGHIQIGAMVPGALAMQDTSVTFDLDNVAVVPTPPAAGIFAAMVIAAARRRRTIRA